MPGNDIPVLGPVLKKFFGSRNERYVKRYTTRVEQIGALEPEMRAMTDAQLKQRVAELRQQHDDGAGVDDLLIPMFGVAREVMDRQIGIRSIFNPEHKFDPTPLPKAAREAFEATRKLISETSDAEPAGDFLGCSEIVPSWRFVEIPHVINDAVRDLHPQSRPPFRSRPFDVQLIGGMVLAGGKIAEMKTGEGKTIVAPLAASLAALRRKQVHVVTVNDYLVQRDRDWVFPFFWGLGMTVGAIHPQHQQPEDVKRQMYRCDVVYGTTSEFGFDYLRDNMKRSVEQQVQRKRQFAIVDEVDSVLIDEARTPLIISGPAHEGQPRYEMADKLARHLVEKQRPWQFKEDEVTACKEKIKACEGDIRQARDRSVVPELQKQMAAEKARLPELERHRDEHTQYYEVKPERKQAYLTHEGVAEAQRTAGIGSFYVDENQDLPHLLEQSVRAHAVYERDKDYVVMDVPDRMTGRAEPSIVIVDTNTGRAMIGRQWSDGLHQAIEFKERVPVKQETQTVASVTVQNFFKTYEQLAGMTGTADTEAEEFHTIYRLDVVAIPTNRPMVRRDRDDLMYLRAKDKWEAITDEIKHFHDAGRPVLVGTTSVEKSETLSQMLQRKHGVRHNVLNAKQHEREAEIIAEAGSLGAVTIATNMAGRGTDIKLARPSRKELLEHWQRRGIASKKLTADSTDDEVHRDVLRKCAATELKDQGLKKREIEEMDFDELELRLLRHWAEKYTYNSPGKLEAADRETLMEWLDESGRIGLHRLRWVESVEDLGGLHVVGTERHESRRIDNQLRGRSGRQGDNGSSRFYVATEDELMKLFMGDTTQKLLARMGLKEGEAVEHPWLSKNVEKAQRKVEERNFQMRKNILEYDEVMEHQRQHFYGLRQRVLEGRDLRGLIFGYIDEAVGDAIGEMLEVDYPAECASEYARNQLDCTVPPERLRGKVEDELEDAIRRLAKVDASHNIDLTLGEYMPVEGSEVSVDFDSAGLVGWAKSRFGVELDAGELREGGAEERRHVKQLLEDAAFEKIDEADLSRLGEFLEANYGAKQLAAWVKRKFGFDVDAEEIAHAKEMEDRSPKDPIMEKAAELYRSREIDYPIEFIMELTKVLARQDPGRAFEELSLFAKQRYGIELTPDEIKKTPPAQIAAKLRQAQIEFVDQEKLGEAIDRFVSIERDEELDGALSERFGAGLPERMEHLEGDEREHAIRSLIENRLRAELVQFERTILLETLDTAWKDHLYAMDQLRDSISYRAFSQQDPRIQYKREGAQIYNEMLERLRDRVTDYVFKAKLTPQVGGAMPPPAGAGRPPAQAPARPPAQPQAQPLSQPRPQPAAGRAGALGGAAGSAGSPFSGPGFDPFAKPAPSAKGSPGRPKAPGGPKGG